MEQIVPIHILSPRNKNPKHVSSGVVAWKGRAILNTAEYRLWLGLNQKLFCKDESWEASTDVIGSLIIQKGNFGDFWDLQWALF